MSDLITAKHDINSELDCLELAISRFEFLRQEGEDGAPGSRIIIVGTEFLFDGKGRLIWIENLESNERELPKER